MSSQLPIVKLNDLVDIKHGFAFKSVHYRSEGKLVLLTPGNFKEAGGFRLLGEKQKYYDGPVHPGAILKKGDILIAMTEQAPGLLGSAIIVPDEDVYLHNQRLGLVDIKNSKETSRGYIYHLFNSSHVRKAIAITSAGTKVKHTSPSKIGAISVPYPPLWEQEEIARMLFTWEDSITLSEGVVTKKEKRHEGLVQALISNTRARKHWETIIFSHLVEERLEKTVVHDQYPVMTSSRRGLFLQSEYFSKQVTSEDNTGYKVIRRGDVTFRSMSDDGLFYFNRLLNHDVGIISPAYGVFYATRCVPEFLVHMLNSTYFANEINRESQGGTRKALRFAAMAQMEIDFPSEQEQKRIASILDTSLQDIEFEKQRLLMLKIQKRGLLDSLLAGILRVRDSRGA